MILTPPIPFIFVPPQTLPLGFMLLTLCKLWPRLGSNGAWTSLWMGSTSSNSEGKFGNVRFCFMDGLMRFVFEPTLKLNSSSEFRLFSSDLIYSISIGGGLRGLYCCSCYSSSSFCFLLGCDPACNSRNFWSNSPSSDARDEMDLKLC